MQFVSLFYLMQLFTFYKYASGVMRQGIGNNLCAFSPPSKPISSYAFRIETLSILFYFSPSKQVVSCAAVSIYSQFLQIQYGGNTSN